jgi:signal transduction histidine kinase
MDRTLNPISSRLSLLRNIHLFGSACFFCFGIIYFLLLHSVYMLAANWVFGAVSALNWFALRSPGWDALKGHVFLLIVYTGLLNVTVHVGAGLEPMIYWGLSISVAAAFTFRIPGILFWVGMSMLFLPLTYLLKVIVFPERVIPLGPGQAQVLTLATYVGLLLFLTYLVYLFQRKLDRALRDLAGRNRELETLFRVVSHDLSGSVHVVRGHGELQKAELDAKRGDPRPLLPEEHGRLAENNDRMREGVERIQTILLSVREYALAASGEKALKAEAVKIDLALRQCIEILAQPVREKNLRLELRLPQELPPVRFHSQTLTHQVLMNLLSNAVKFSPPGGTIEVRVEPRGNKVRLLLTDEGAGFPATPHPRALEERVGYSEAGTLGEKGTGFGLAIAQAYLARYRSTLEILPPASSGARGARILVTFEAV